MSENLKNIGRRIERLILENRLTRAELGEIIGVGAGAIGRYIRGEADAGSEAIAKIAEKFDVTTDYLINGEDGVRGNQIIGQVGKGKTHPSFELFASLLENKKAQVGPNQEQQKILDEVKEEVAAYARHPFNIPFDPLNQAEKNKKPELDRDLLIEAAATIRDAEAKLDRYVPADKLGELIMFIYDDYVKGIQTEPAKVITMVRLVA